MRAATVFLLLALVACKPTAQTASREIEPQHLACAVDEDCVIVELGCGCPCSGGERKGAVNKAHAARYAEVASCTPAQTKRCAEVRCAQNKRPSPVCAERVCDVRWDPVR